MNLNSNPDFYLFDQMCDGRVDCLGGGADECGEMCARRRCEEGVRCETDDVCIAVPHRHVCNGENQDQVQTLDDFMSICMQTLLAAFYVAHCRHIGIPRDIVHKECLSFR